MSSSTRFVLTLSITGLALLSGTSAVAADSAVAATTPAPIRSFFRSADIDEVRLSPSGKWVAITVGGKSARVALAVVDVDGKQPPVIVAQFADSDIRSFRWVGDERLIFNVVDLEVGGGEQTFGPGMFSVRRDGRELRQLIQAKAGLREIANARRELLKWNHVLLSVPDDGSDEIIVGEYVFSEARELLGVNAARLNVATGQTRSLAAGRPSHTIGWLFDPKGEPRVTVAIDNGVESIYWREPGKGDWSLIGSGPSLHPPFAPFFADGAGHLYVLADSGPEGWASLRRFDFDKKQPDPTPVVATPGFDFRGSVLYDIKSSNLHGFRVETDAETTVWLDPRMKELQRIVDAKLPGHVNRISSCRRCEEPTLLLVASSSDQDPGQFWLYRPATDAWQFLGAERADIDARTMATLDFHRIKARDGLDLPVWVTTPPADAPGGGKGPRPAVVLVHGGPWVHHGSWHWDADAQFLASRGYVVIEPAFRGDLGYGTAHFQAGWKQWEGPMQDDVADAVRWAVGKGMIDGKKVCIAGASYGGYATLMGLARYPDLYRCGVAWVAVTDPRLLFEPIWNSDMSEEAKKFGMRTLIGDPDKDAAMFRSAAPVERAAEIRAPLLLAFGREDQRVPLVHGTRFRDALRAAGRDPEFVVYDGEGHGWLKIENRLDFYGRVERFLAKNLGP